MAMSPFLSQCTGVSIIWSDGIELSVGFKLAVFFHNLSSAENICINSEAVRILVLVCLLSVEISASRPVLHYVQQAFPESVSSHASRYRKISWVKFGPANRLRCCKIDRLNGSHTQYLRYCWIGYGFHMDGWLYCIRYISYDRI